MTRDKASTVILLTEDNAGHAHLIKKLLQRSLSGVDIQHFSNGKDLLSFLSETNTSSQERHYVLLLDSNLPEMDGFQIINKIKQTELIKTVPVIILSSSDNVDEIQRYYELGCTLYLQKPVDYVAFKETIHHIGKIISIAHFPRL